MYANRMEIFTGLNPLLFCFFLLLFPMGTAYAQSVNAGVIILTDHEIGFSNDVIKLSSTQPLDLSSLNSTAPVNSTQTIGNSTINLTREVTFVAEGKDVIILENIALPTVTVEISDRTTILAPEDWDNTILPPIVIPTTGNIPSGFEKPDNVILVGSADVILIFDKTVTIILEGITGQTAYKLPGETIWYLIEGCSDTYDNPKDPLFPNECSIGNGTDTKIVTYHFTEFGAFPKIPVENIEEPTTSSGGGTSKRPSTSAGGGSSGITKWSDVRFTEEKEEPTLIPQWLKLPVSWWLSNEINNEEFFNMITYLVDNNILQIEEKIKPKESLTNFNPSIKNIFLLWHDDKINERVLMGLIEEYRGLGIW